MLPISCKRVCNSRKAQRHFSLQAFTVVIVCLATLTTLSLVIDYQHTPPQRLPSQQLDIPQLTKRDQECRFVRHAEDKCAFIKANCPDEEAGLLSYLSLYYCYLPKVPILAFGILSLWLALLFTTIGIAASDFFCINLNTIASKLGMSESIAGTTFLAFGNGSPDLFSTFAAMNSNSGSLAVGELIGAAGFITAVVAGSMALAREFRVGKKTLVRDVTFFIIAVCLTIIFLLDGSLHLWEFCVMVGYYLLYVFVIFIWHWYYEIRRRRLEQKTDNHGLDMANEEQEIQEEDNSDEDGSGRRMHGKDVLDPNILEQRSFPAILPHSGDDDESNESNTHGNRLAAEMVSNMRVTRPIGSRRNTITPIRPSLVGALEFRSVFASYVEKSSQLQNQHMQFRRYSDDEASFESSIAKYRDSSKSNNMAPDRSLLRIRASTFNDVSTIKIKNHKNLREGNVSNIEISEQSAKFTVDNELPRNSRANLLSASQSLAQGSRLARASNSYSCYRHRKQPSETPTVLEDDDLPPVQFFVTSANNNLNGYSESVDDSSRMLSPGTPLLRVESFTSQNSSHSHRSSVSIFPSYVELQNGISTWDSKRSSLIPPSLIRTPESPEQEIIFQKSSVCWWLNQYFPSSYTIGRSLFPTLCTWGQKSIWDKFVSVISAPSIFLLAITLPVVELESPEDSKSELQFLLESNVPSRIPSRRSLSPNTLLDAQPEWLACKGTIDSLGHPSSLNQSFKPHPHTAHSVDEFLYAPHSSTHHTMEDTLNCNEYFDSGLDYTNSQDWNRWLVSTHIFTSPVFLIFIFWANSAERDSRMLAEFMIYSLLGSLVTYSILVFTTSPSRVPRYRFILCFLGFVVSIAWISTIAGEVVGVLKAVGVILDISDAILGLTIFAVGSSLGDLVANITMARLGFPVMALSACFGGPMLNILLGIGLSGIYVTFSEANIKHTKNPNTRIKFKPYEIEVSRTLMISAVTLLITLIGILIFIPLNGWVMNKRIGWGLIILWIISTIANLGFEVSSIFVS